MAVVKFRAGLAKDLPKKRNADTLYWVTDTRQLYKGNDLYTDAVRVVSETPAEPLVGVLYIVNGVVKTYTGTEWAIISLPVTNDPNANSEEYILSSAAVKTAVTEAVEVAIQGTDTKLDNVINTIVSTEAGTITVTKGSTDESIDLAGVVYEPTFDPSTRTIKLPYNKVVDGVVEKDALVISLGQDMVVTNDSYYDKENKKIILVLTSGENVEIPVEDLIPVIEISQLDGNALIKNADGFYVKDLSGDIAEVSGKVLALEESVQRINDAIGVSVKEINDAIEANTKAIIDNSNAIENNREAISEIMSSIDVINDKENGILAQAKAYADSKVCEINWEVFEG